MISSVQMWVPSKLTDICPLRSLPQVPEAGPSTTKPEAVKPMIGHTTKEVKSTKRKISEPAQSAKPKKSKMGKEQVEGM